MAKARLGTLTEKWIDGKNEKPLSIKKDKQNTVNGKKIMMSLYMSEKAAKLLRYHRVETGEPVSHTLERLTLEYFGKEIKG